ncbi:MAG: hypothetical protein ABS55_08655 [Lautropia sp. SCN 70-15]|nr:MAG: hypothetical protein ABS55_08655 [Lautropia sp. SCN 70-15]
MREDTVRVWDLPTRLFHWGLAACVIGSLVTINLGGNAVAWHFRFGYAILTLLIFRLAWGFVGPRYARFASFPPNPMAALRYLRGQERSVAGHSPLGALSVYALLLSLAFQAGTGLFANDAIMWDGPLRNTVSNATSDWLTSLHKTNRFVLLGLIALHLAAIAYYALLERKPLVRPMITGDAPLPADQPRAGAAGDGLRERSLASILLAASGGIVWAVIELLP